MNRVYRHFLEKYWKKGRAKCPQMQMSMSQKFYLLTQKRSLYPNSNSLTSQTMLLIQIVCISLQLSLEKDNVSRKMFESITCCVVSCQANPDSKVQDRLLQMTYLPKSNSLYKWRFRYFSASIMFKGGAGMF